MLHLNVEERKVFKIESVIFRHKPTQNIKFPAISVSRWWWWRHKA